MYDYTMKCPVNPEYIYPNVRFSKLNSLYGVSFELETWVRKKISHHRHIFVRVYDSAILPEQIDFSEKITTVTIKNFYAEVYKVIKLYKFNPKLDQIDNDLRTEKERLICDVI